MPAQQKGLLMDYTKKQILDMYVKEALETGISDTKADALEYARTMFEVDYMENSIVKVGHRYQLANQLI